MAAVEEWVNGKDPDFFSSGLMALEHRCSKCITLEGNYIEKKEVDLNRNFFFFFCVEVLWPGQPNGVMSSAVSLPNHTFTGQA